MELEIKYASRNDLTYIDHLQKKNSNDLSFYPGVVFEREVDKERILLALVNKQHAGYLYHGKMAMDCALRIHQACIEYDLRGNWYGAGLVKFLEDLGKINHIGSISLRCGSDISANRFWELMGFSCIDIQPGGVSRMRDINVWYKQIIEDLFGSKPSVVLEPSTKKKDMSIWRKKKKGTSQNKMLRGKALLQYRQKILDQMEVENT
tara:strand:+ start:73 stop:690 length:618 start_codon:yes stop_codon:yes gene_type:complete